MATTKHATVRAQQRAIPPLIDRWLDEFGEEAYDGNGLVRVFFSHKSIREMQRSFGRRPVALMNHYLRAYRLESTDGKAITIGWLTRQIRRK
ncbi:MAG: hypothetical protein D4S02_09940 [Rhodocyclaceae bacterium]|nr:MAG: hypothetical protein D4S02_09940 [Rhodocyclaceae bacterium]